VGHLTDIRTALRVGKRVLTRVVLAWLTELNPADWVFQDLAAPLAEYILSRLQ